MDKKEAERQIEQMIAFIKQEAKEKEEEIRVKTENEFMAKKLSLTTEASLAIREEFELKRKERLIAKRIERSKKLNDSRYQAMRFRDDQLKVLKDAVREKLTAVSRHKKYRELLKFLLVQGMMSLMEELVIVQYRKEDEELVKGLLEESINYFKEYMEKETGVVPPVVLKLSSEYLPPAPSKEPGPSCTGGVILSARKGQLICRNTLDSRLEHAFYKLAPTIRGILFGVRERPKNAWKEGDDDEHH